MSPIQAVKTALSKYVTFSGRARRSEYWWFWLFGVVVAIVAAVIDFAVFDQGGTTTTSTTATFSVGGGPASLVAALALLLPSLAVQVRRLHDTDRSGWWILIGLIPLIGTIVLLVFYVTDSKPDNRFGPSPKGATEAVTA